MISSSRALFALLVCGLFVGACRREPAPVGIPASVAASVPPTRIVPASSSAVDFVCALVGPERVAGVPEQAIDYSILHSSDQRWAKTPRFYAYQAEPLLALAPDLVVVCPYQSRDTSERLKDGGVALFELGEIANWRDARAALLAVGERIGLKPKAEALVADLDRRVAALVETASRRHAVRAMCYSNFGSQGWTAGSKTTIDEIMELAGVTNVVAVAGREGHQTISFEELITLDPDVIIVGEPLSTPASSAGDRGGASEQLLMHEASLSGLRAVRERRILPLPAWFFATGSHEMVHGAELLSTEVDALLARTSGAAKQ